MSSRFDDWAKASARPGMTRRDVMKRAGIIGVATVWATPIVQSVGAPAFAATGLCIPSDPSGCGGTCPNKCAAGLTCATTADCNTGLACAPNNTCKLADGQNCSGANPTGDASCASGKCGGSGSQKVCLRSQGAACTTGNQCASGTCAALVCT